MLFETTKYNYFFIFALWGISIGFEIFFEYARHDDILKQGIQANIQFIPQFQMLAYSAYLMLFLYLKTHNVFLGEKLKRDRQNFILYANHATTTFATSFVDLVMITVTTFSFFNVAYGASSNFFLNWHLLFLHVIFPLMALGLIYYLRNKKLRFRESTESRFGIYAAVR